MTTTEPTLTLATQADWDAWLARHGETARGVWLRLSKRSAKKPTLSYAEAVECALCHGWIDGLKRAENEDYWLQRFTPRQPTSLWSRLNREKAEALIAAGRMHPAGLREVERARQNGRWDAAYASSSTSTVPDDLRQALDADPRAKAFFATLDRQNRYAILFRIHNVKKADTRARKINEFVRMLAEGRKIHS